MCASRPGPPDERRPSPTCRSSPTRRLAPALSRRQWAWWVYVSCSLVVAVGAFATHRFYSRWAQRKRPLAHSGIILPVTFTLYSALLGGAQMIVHSKVLSELLYMIFHGGVALLTTSWLLYVELLLCIACGIVWVVKLTECLTLYNPLLILPLMVGTYILFGGVAGGLFFAEFQARAAARPSLRTLSMSARTHALGWHVRHPRAMAAHTALRPRLRRARQRLHEGVVGWYGWGLYSAGLVSVLCGLATIAVASQECNLTVAAANSQKPPPARVAPDAVDAVERCRQARSGAGPLPTASSPIKLPRGTEMGMPGTANASRPEAQRTDLDGLPSAVAGQVDEPSRRCDDARTPPPPPRASAGESSSVRVSESSPVRVLPQAHSLPRPSHSVDTDVRTQQAHTPVPPAGRPVPAFTSEEIVGATGGRSVPESPFMQSPFTPAASSAAPARRSQALATWDADLGQIDADLGA